MKITAVAVGTRGDVNPLVELGSEMTKKEKGRTELSKSYGFIRICIKEGCWCASSIWHVGKIINISLILGAYYLHK